MKTVKIDEKIDVLFFERPVSDLKRYAFKIAKFLKEIDPKIKMASISLELPEDESEKCVDYYILKNSALYAEYKKLADAEEKVIFGGRLGEYKYYDMDAVIASALDMCERELQ